jgi:micrococcal nuclease
MYEYSARVLRVIDGDTLHLEIDLGFNVVIRDKVRLYGVNTPETSGPKAKTEKTAGAAATAFVTAWVADKPAVVLRSHDAKAIGQEKYGRWLAVLTPAGGGISLNDALIESGHAVKLVY